MKWFFITILILPLLFSCQKKATKESTASDELAMDTVNPVEAVAVSPDAFISSLSDMELQQNTRH